MNEAIDIDETAAGDEGGLDPRAAALLLKQTDEQAKLELNMNPPVMSLFAAALILTVYGGLYMAAHGEHPYTGPKGPWLLVWPLGLLVIFVLRGSQYGQLKKTITGHTLVRIRATSAIMVAALIGVYTIDGALYHAGVGKNIVYGIFDASVPLVVMGSIGGACAAWREDWPTLGVCIAIILVATGAAFAGPDGVWGVIAIGGCIACLGHAAAKIWLQRR